MDNLAAHDWTRAELAGVDASVLVDMVAELLERQRFYREYLGEALTLLGRTQAALAHAEREREWALQDLARYRETT